MLRTPTATTSSSRRSRRARYWTIGKTEEGRDIVALAIADEATIKSLESTAINLRR